MTQINYFTESFSLSNSSTEQHNSPFLRQMTIPFNEYKATVASRLQAGFSELWVKMLYVQGTLGMSYFPFAVLISCFKTQFSSYYNLLIAIIL